ncbi:Hypothetical predicted protein [Mytilus galloprovincialis]|uniref:Uncharacterized protein n=1 Tax=Mytilus galloprovincialis TaxID=29158 RepID=A0A8B6GN79_MYTGA|nr:Hypothetical predicted protein [Mytilus galloprovincialis]
MAQKVGKTVMKSMLHHKDVMAVMGLVGAAGVLGGIALIYSAVHDPDISFVPASKLQRNLKSSPTTSPLKVFYPETYQPIPQLEAVHKDMMNK